VLKVGRRLVVKIFNASKFVLSQSGPLAPVAQPLDLAFLARLRETVETATAALEAFEYSTALDVTERFFWGRFTDTYVEMVKARARSEHDPAGRGSAVATLRLALRTLLRLFAPFLPYITEEVWSWEFAGSEASRSIHRSRWPAHAEFADLAPPEGGTAAFDAAIAFLEALNRAKSASGASVGRHVERLRVAAHPRTARMLEPALADVLAAARVLEHSVETRDGMDEGVFEVLETRLAEVRPGS
jgi:valyl-tRNA synthetase